MIQVFSNGIDLFAHVNREEAIKKIVNSMNEVGTSPLNAIDRCNIRLSNFDINIKRKRKIKSLPHVSVSISNPYSVHQSAYQ